MDPRFDSRLFELIPHRPPMLLINHVVAVNETAASSLVHVHHDSPFYAPDKGIPAWVGLEYMGQTAALIAGYQLEQGLVTPHLGFLLGTRAFNAECDYFTAGTLAVSCTEKALVGEGLAMFDCMIEKDIEDGQRRECLARASLSVFRREITKDA